MLMASSMSKMTLQRYSVVKLYNSKSGNYGCLCPQSNIKNTLTLYMLETFTNSPADP
uniref:Uncharacterized protein n=1 Tax=Anguilla anguilla TaxID=7936 RepID=A0A0E9WKZ6_ANGAN